MNWRIIGWTVLVSVVIVGVALILTHGSDAVHSLPDAAAIVMLVTVLSLQARLREKLFRPDGEGGGRPASSLLPHRLLRGYRRENRRASVPDRPPHPSINSLHAEKFDVLNRKLHRDKWQVYFDNLTKALQQGAERYVLLRVSTAEGTRDVAPWLEFEQIRYDPDTGSLNVRLDGFDYSIEHPIIIWAAVDADGHVDRLVVLRHDGARDYIEFSRHRFPYSAIPHHASMRGLSPAASHYDRSRGIRSAWQNLFRRRGVA